MDNNTAIALMFWVIVSLATLVVIWLVTRARAQAGLRLTLLGIVVALVALWYGLLTGLPASRGTPLPLGHPGLADTALRLAAVLVLGGIVVSLLVRETAPAVPVEPEVTRNVPPSV